MKRPRYVAAARPSWCPPRFVVIDSHTGAILSKHAVEVEAEAAARGMNLSRR